MKLENCLFFNRLVRNIRNQKSFTLTGLTSFSKLLLLKYIKDFSGKKILFITSTEQASLRYSVDLERLFGLNSEQLPYQNVSLYETLRGNVYDYQKQINVLINKPEIVIAPIKVFVEKFPREDFFKENTVHLKIGDNISQKDLLQYLINLGYKRATMVSDMGEFSIRGDVADVYGLAENPARIEFWGDEIVDIRVFDNETQKSVEKLKFVEISPLFKFILPKNKPDGLPKELSEQLSQEGYFEGINVYQSYFNTELVSVLDYFKDYVVVFDEYAELLAKLNQVEIGLEASYNEALKLGLIYSLKDLNHFSENDFIQKLASFQKAYPVSLV